MKPQFKYFVILGMMRTGSNLLQDRLSQFDGISAYGEIFNPFFIGESGKKTFFDWTLQKRDQTPLDFLEHIVSMHENVVPGFRFFQGHTKKVLDHILLDSSCAKIILKRNYLDSFLSYKIAQATNQWLLGAEKDRVSKTIEFKPDEFLKFEGKMAGFYHYCETALKRNGQGHFELTYEDLEDIDVVNGCASYIADIKPIKRFQQNIVKQNPGSAEEKVTNPEALQPFINTKQKIEFSEAELLGRYNSRDFIIHESGRFFYAPLQCSDSLSDKTGFDIKGGAITGLSRNDLWDRLSKEKDPVIFTTLRHPVLRIYTAFMNHFFAHGPQRFEMIADILRDDFDVIFPKIPDPQFKSKQECEDDGYDLKLHRKNFIGFLRFVRESLNHNIEARIDMSWVPQVDLLQAVTQILPVHYLVKEHDLEQISKTLFKDIEISASYPEFLNFNIEDIYNERIEKLIRKSFEKDYIAFGFEDFKS